MVDRHVFLHERSSDRQRDHPEDPEQVISQGQEETGGSGVTGGNTAT